MSLARLQQNTGMRATVTPACVLTLPPRVYRAAIGHGGIRRDKWEGDGATPCGLLPLRQVLYRPDRIRAPQATVPVHPLQPDSGWCDDPTHPDYNRSVRLPFSASHEALWREDAVYDVIGILGWNDNPVIPGRGSAIFLHVARPDYSPTEGCIALSLADLLQVLAANLTDIEIAGSPL